MNLLAGTNKTLLDLSLLLLRCITGIILFVAGAGKAMGWFGGFGMKTNLEHFEKGGFSPFLAYLSTYTEFIGGFLLIIGLLTRPAALGLFINMLVAVITVGWTNFFMGGGAYPFHLMICSLIILLAGPMAFSLDALLGGGKKLKG